MFDRIPTQEKPRITLRDIPSPEQVSIIENAVRELGESTVVARTLIETAVYIIQEYPQKVELPDLDEFKKEFAKKVYDFAYSQFANLVSDKKEKILETMGDVFDQLTN